MSEPTEVERLAAEPASVPELYQDEQDPAVNSTSWHVTQLADVDWAMSRLAALEQEISENESLAAVAISRIEMRLQKLNEKAARGAEFFRSRIAEYCGLNRSLLLKGGKKKTRDFLHGKVSWRSKGGGLQVVDAAQLLDWARAQPVELGLVRITEAPALVEIKKYAAEKNLIPPGTVEATTVEELSVHADLASDALTTKGH